MLSSCARFLIAFGPTRLSFVVTSNDSPVIIEYLQQDSSTAVPSSLSAGDFYYSFMVKNVTSHTLNDLTMEIKLTVDIPQINSSQQVYDETIGTLKLRFYLQSNQNPVLYTINDCAGDVCWITNPSFSLYGLAGDVKPVSMTYQSNRYELTTWFLLQFQSCVKGEIFYAGTQTCEYCAENYYASNESCLLCPSGAFCSKGVIQKVYEGYWRNSTESNDVYECPSTDSGSCLGENLCSDGYTGVLCRQCDYEKGFLSGTGDGYNCKGCPSYAALVVRAIAYFLVTLGI